MPGPDFAPLCDLASHSLVWCRSACKLLTPCRPWRVIVDFFLGQDISSHTQKTESLVTYKTGSDIKVHARGFRCTLKRHPADCAGPQPIWMHERNCVYSQPVLVEAHPGGVAGAIMRSVFRCSRRHLMEMAALRMAGLAATRWVCLGELSTRRCDAHLTFLRASDLRCVHP